MNTDANTSAAVSDASTSGQSECLSVLMYDRWPEDQWRKHFRSYIDERGYLHVYLSILGESKQQGEMGRGQESAGVEGLVLFSTHIPTVRRNDKLPSMIKLPTGQVVYKFRDVVATIATPGLEKNETGGCVYLCRQVTRAEQFASEDGFYSSDNDIQAKATSDDLDVALLLSPKRQLESLSIWSPTGEGKKLVEIWKKPVSTEVPPPDSDLYNNVYLGLLKFHTESCRTWRMGRDPGSSEVTGDSQNPIMID